MLAVGYVVRTHPGDQSVDLVLTDGRRITGAQITTPNGSTRSGTFDMPAVPEKADPWDITKLTGQDQKAIVGFFDGKPVVLGFLTPQINQMTFDDPKMRVDRHQSDVIQTIDGDGNIQISHPSGTYVRIGEAPDQVDLSGKNNDGSLAVDRNTGKKVFVRIGMAGGAAVFTISPTGAVSLTTQQTVTIEADGDVMVKTPSATIDAPEARCTGNLTVDGLLTYKGGLTGSGGQGATMQGNLNVQGSGEFSGDLLNGGENSNHHSH